MRKTYHEQQPLMQAFLDHEHARELGAMSAVLDEIPDFLEGIRRNLVETRRDDRGRRGMTAEQTLRSAMVKQLNGFSYAELEFHLADSRTYRRFCRFGDFDKTPSRSTLQENIKRVSAESFELVNRCLARLAVVHGIETGERIRIDTTSVESNIHPPTDSLLLLDVNRVLTRLLKKSRTYGVSFRGHMRTVKRRAFGIQNARGREQREPLYRDLVRVSEEILTSSEEAVRVLRASKEARVGPQSAASQLAESIDHYRALGWRVVHQTRRRIFNGERVPAREKVISIFETHTDILVKGRLEVEYGHKVNLAVGKSSLVTDCVIEKGNPADSTLAVKMIERQRDIFGRPPRQAAFDGGFASKDNLRQIKSQGVPDVAFAKRCGLAIDDMVKSTWVYKRLKHFRAGIEGVISFLKRCFGLGRCTWRGFRSFQAYVWASVLSANLLIFARHRLGSVP